MTLSPRDRRALLLGAAGLVVICAAHFAVIPWVESWTAAREQIVANQQQLRDQERLIRSVLGQQRRLMETYGLAVNNQLEDLETARVSLFKEVQEVLKTSDFKLTDYQPRPPRILREISGVEIVPLQVRGKCQLPQLVKCLSGMRKADTLVIVDRISVTNDEKKPGQLEVTMVLATLAEQKKEGS
ncbi:MAG: GspMb/PilO family protein [Planctomycetota bacterium]|nr:GspMb/PilO family protein [Planctomycetota bacterium]